MKNIRILLLGLLLAVIVSGCGNNATGTKTEEEKLIVGATAGPHEQIMEKVKEVAKKDGLDIELKIFSDYILPNKTLADGELDANSYQHQPFLDQFNKDHDTDLVSVGKTILNPMGVYSEDYQSIDDLPKGAKFGLPNDPTNGSRALFILEKAGHIQLANDAKETASLKDIKENPKNLEFIELDAAQIPKQLSEVDAAAINTNFAIDAGLYPKEDAILLESTDSPYTNVIAVRDENKDDAVVKKLVKAYQSDEVKTFIEEEFRGSIIVSWE
ncbi:MetQ/NlpA family ABC transporter substrate-binding protein [Siminovitchia sp. FSL H7-0308]|uniref:Lipoprotein n=1 Tax=Siminovitchia thermophila TaxID=1245522 RepID=A0ABS2R9S1_9BACI|nr:MetQ/NlpA family ABC transporter substrate-binding protein [Siminovitchia thermophila]MBM7716135.1 D-methionine transport system substrate-binding protein [Siminovitchia thermophila]ONK22417.1 metal ABC transporter substrate-binding protein [Bacillus sp. VT-16-64]